MQTTCLFVYLMAPPGCSNNTKKNKKYCSLHVGTYDVKTFLWYQKITKVFIDCCQGDKFCFSCLQVSHWVSDQKSWEFSHSHSEPTDLFVPYALIWLYLCTFLVKLSHWLAIWFSSISPFFTPGNVFTLIQHSRADHHPEITENIKTRLVLLKRTQAPVKSLWVFRSK